MMPNSDQQPPDSVLLQQLAGTGRSAEKAFELLYKRYRQTLLRFALGRGVDRSTAEDIVQNVFIKLQKQVKRSTEIGSAVAWLIKVTLNEVTDSFRASTRTVTMDDEGWDAMANHMVDPNACPYEALRKKGAQDCVDEAYRRFMKEHPGPANALLWSLRLNMSIAEIAQQIQRTERATTEHLSQARKKLNALIAPCLQHGSP